MSITIKHRTHTNSIGISIISKYQLTDSDALWMLGQIRHTDCISNASRISFPSTLERPKWIFRKKGHLQTMFFNSHYQSECMFKKSGNSAGSGDRPVNLGHDHPSRTRDMEREGLQINKINAFQTQLNINKYANEKVFFLSLSGLSNIEEQPRQTGYSIAILFHWIVLKENLRIVL